MNKNKFIFFLVMLINMYQFTYGKVVVTMNKNVEGITSLKTNVLKALTKLVPACLAVSLVVVVWLVATNSDKAKSAVISWVVAALIYGIALAIIK